VLPFQDYAYALRWKVNLKGQHISTIILHLVNIYIKLKPNSILCKW